VRHILEVKIEYDDADKYAAIKRVIMDGTVIEGEGVDYGVTV